MLTLNSVLQRNRNIFQNKPAIIDQDISLNWKQYVERISKSASYLSSLGIKPGDRFGILSLNSFRQAEIINAGYWLGATPVPINFRLAPIEISNILNDANCKRLFIAPAFKKALDSTYLKSWEEKNTSIDPDTYDSLANNHPPLKPIDYHEDTEALVLYTGGTSGSPKGVSLSNKNIICNAMQISLNWPATQNNNIVLHVAPMFHSADLALNPFYLQGSAHVYLHKFSPELFGKTVEKYKVTTTLLTPTMIIRTLESDIINKYDLSSFKYLLYGSSPIEPKWIKKTIDTFPNIEIMQGYGLTETSPILSLLDNTTHRSSIKNNNYKHLNSCGKPLTGVDIRIVDENGIEQPIGESGEILARGPNVFRGYLNNSIETEKAIKSEWFYTGDIGKVDSDGYLYILDRKKDIVIMGGEKIYPSEIEAIINQHPAVLETAVIGIPNQKYGESLIAIIEKKEGVHLDKLEMYRFCQGKIGAYKIPRKIKFIEKMPKSALGKTLKRSLREEFKP